MFPVRPAGGKFGTVQAWVWFTEVVCIFQWSDHSVPFSFFQGSSSLSSSGGIQFSSGSVHRPIWSSERGAGGEGGGDIERDDQSVVIVRDWFLFYQESESIRIQASSLSSTRKWPGSCTSLKQWCGRRRLQGFFKRFPRLTLLFCDTVG